MISVVILSYSINGGETWTNVTMNVNEGNVYKATIPEHSATTIVKFKIIVFDNAGNLAVSPIYSYEVVSKITSTHRVSGNLAIGIGVAVAVVATVVFIVIRRRR